MRDFTFIRTSKMKNSEMTKVGRCFLGVLLAFVLAFSLCPISAFAVDGQEDPSSMAVRTNAVSGNSDANTVSNSNSSDANNSVTVEKDPSESSDSVSDKTQSEFFGGLNNESESQGLSAENSQAQSTSNSQTNQVDSNNNEEQGVSLQNSEENLLDTVYLNPSSGNDEATGNSVEEAVQSFDRAKELLATDGTIELIGALRPTGTVTYSLEGKGNARIVRCNPDHGDMWMLYIDAGANVTLDHIVFDGQKANAAEGIVRVENESSLTLEEGAVIENSITNSGHFGSAIEAYDDAKVVMKDGSFVRNNSTTSAGYGAVLVANSSELEMYGGEISGNRSSRGGGVALLASDMTMRGGTISGNTAYYISSGGGYGGGVYVSNYEAYSGTPGSDVIKSDDSHFTMTGGTIEDNHADVYGGGILTWAESRAPAGETFVDLQRGSITGNSADNSGGGVVAFLWSGNDCHLSISGDTAIAENEAVRFGGGVFLYGVGKENLATMAGGTIQGNHAGWDGGGIALYQGSTMSITGGDITEDNTANIAGGGAYIQDQSRLVMTGGTIKGNNASSDQSKTQGDGVYVGGTFEVADGENGGPVIDQDNDVYLPSGHVIDVVGSFTGATASNPINITSADCTIEPEGGSTPGTKLVNYHNEAGGVDAAQKADDDGIYVPSAKMLEDDPTLAIGKSENQNQRNYMTYVKQTEQPWYYEVYYHFFDPDSREWSWVRFTDGQGGWSYPNEDVSIRHEDFDGKELGWDALDGSGPEILGDHYVFDQDNSNNRLSAKAKDATKDNPLKIYYDATSHTVSYEYEGQVPSYAPDLPQATESQYSLVEEVEEVPSLPGYTFTGWTTDDVADECWFDDKNQGEFYMPNNDVVFKGTWTVNAYLKPQAMSLVAYEGGNGSEANPTDALPDPEWRYEAEDWAIYFDGTEQPKGTEPFNWGYFPVGSEDEQIDPALKGVYELRVWPLEGVSEVAAVANDGQSYILDLKNEEAVLDENGEPVVIKVRDVTDDEGAAALSNDLFKPVYSTSGSSTFALFSANAKSVICDEACEKSQIHAHVAEGTTFEKNGIHGLPVNNDANIALLVDDFIPDVLGSDSRMNALDEKASDVVGGAFAHGGYQKDFCYMDLVDTNDGNLWVAPVDESSVTVFIPYNDSMTKDSEIAVAYFDGLTRDYTIDMASADLDAEVAATNAHSLEITKGEEGITFEVPYKQFGPFELMWAADEGESEDNPEGEPDEGVDDPSGEGPSGNGSNNEGPLDQNSDSSENQTDSGYLSKTGDFMVPIIATFVGLIVLASAGIAIYLRKGRNPKGIHARR